MPILAKGLLEFLCKSRVFWALQNLAGVSPEQCLHIQAQTSKNTASQTTILSRAEELISVILQTEPLHCAIQHLPHRRIAW